MRREIVVVGNFPQGNVCDVSIEMEEIPVIYFFPSPKGGPECMWFYFKVKAKKIKKLKLILKHFYNMLGGNIPENIRPVIKYQKGRWERMKKPQVISIEDGRVLVAWEIRLKEEFFEFALCYPYGREELEKMLQECGSYWKKDVIGVSQKEREIIRISNFYKNLKKKGVYLIARQHSGETPGSWVMDGFLRYLSEINYRNMIVWAVPLSNIDGIEEGFYGKDNFPYDLNRAWGIPPMRHETLVIQKDIIRWKERCRPFLSIDFHAPGVSEIDGAYFFVTNEKKDRKMYHLEKEIVVKIAKKIGSEYLSKNYVRSINYKSRWETPHFSDFFRYNFKIPSFTMEIPYSICGNIVMKEKDYREIGKRIAITLVEEIEK